MFTTALAVTTVLMFGLGLYLHLECRDKDARIIRLAGQRKRLTADVHSLQRQLQTEIAAKQRLIIRNRLLTCQVQDQNAVERQLVHQVDGLLYQLEGLQVDHARVVLGGTMLPDCPE